LKTYTPFRLNPRIFPAVVSATVATSEAMTVPRPRTFAAAFVFLSAFGVASANAVAGKITEPANPAPRVAIAPIKERRSLNACPDSRFRRFFDVIPNPPLVVLSLRRFSITEIVNLSIKITLGTPEANKYLTSAINRGYK
jgi:hypothetical protein